MCTYKEVVDNRIRILDARRAQNVRANQPAMVRIAADLAVTQANIARWGVMNDSVNPPIEQSQSK